ncbi:MAG: hypothetical protein AB8B81_02280 [Halioglobus sp.]
MDQLQIDDIVRRIDGSFGEELPFSGRALTENDIEVLQRIFGDGGFQDYLDDQANRQIIRVYLTNAIILGFLPEMQVEDYSHQIESREGRAALSLHILMNSVEDAHTLPVETDPENLKKLRAERGSPPHLRVIRS